MIILDLPNEVLMHIISFLRSHDVDCLARTLNTTITPICVSFLSDWLFYARNERRMIASFGLPRSFDQDGIFEEMFSRRQSELGSLKFSAPPEEPVTRLRAIEYLNLNGDLHWLRKHDMYSDYDWGRTHGALPGSQLSVLQNTCKQLGLILPNGFPSFITNEDLHDWLVPAAASWPEFDHLAQITSPNVNGYVFQFRRDLDYSLYYLFLSTDGVHCVLSSDEDLDSLSVGREDMESDIKLYQADACHIKRLRLEATSFEEFLVRTYFERWTRWINYKAPKAIPENLKQYLIRVFTEEGRKSFE